jgi:hypothetical protein
VKEYKVIKYPKLPPLSKATKRWLAVRKREALKIDPATAEVHGIYGQTLDPYCIIEDLPDVYRQSCWNYFVRTPGSDIWVWDGDLPEAARKALWKRFENKDKPSIRSRRKQRSPANGA